MLRWLLQFNEQNINYAAKRQSTQPAVDIAANLFQDLQSSIASS